MVHQRFFEGSKDYGIAKEKQEVCMDIEMWKHYDVSRIFLMTTPIIKFPDMDEDLLVCTDVSKEGLGRVLMKDGQVITYISWKLRKHEEN
jgi:hypothetical protein